MEPVNVKIQRKADAATPLFPEIGQAGFVKGTLRSVAVLEGGMTSGKTSLWFNVETHDGKWVCAEVSAAMLQMIAGTVRGAEQRWAEGKS